MDSKQTGTGPVTSPNIAETPPAGEGNKMIWVIVAVIVILIIGGLYFYISSQQNGTPVEQTPTQTTKVQENLDSDLDDINVSSGEDDFSSVDADLQSL